MPKETSTLESSRHSISQSTTEPVALESETSADELFQDVGQGSSLSHKRLTREPEKHSSNPEIKFAPRRAILELTAKLGAEFGARRQDDVG